MRREIWRLRQRPPLMSGFSFKYRRDRHQGIPNSGRNPVGIGENESRIPRVARASQPWAVWQNPVGIKYRKIPTGFRPRAQGWRIAPTLGASPQLIINPNGAAPSWRCVRAGRNPVGIEAWALGRNPFWTLSNSDPRLKIPTGFRPPAQGCAGRATLGQPSANPTTPTGLRQSS